MYLQTDRLLLRPVEYMDIDQLVAMWADPEVTRYLGGPRDLHEVRSLLDEQVDVPSRGAFGQHPLIEKATGSVVGSCGLVGERICGRDEVEFVHIIGSRFGGKGYALEIGDALLRFAFGTLGLKRVVSLVHPENELSRRVAESLGMLLESRVPQPDGVQRELWVAEREG
ncbi:MAG: GNAT family N-acetyltransferase [Coriobacteriia bacterium]